MMYDLMAIDAALVLSKATFEQIMAAWSPSLTLRSDPAIHRPLSSQGRCVSRAPRSCACPAPSPPPGVMPMRRHRVLAGRPSDVSGASH